MRAGNIGCNVRPKQVLSLPISTNSEDPGVGLSPPAELWAKITSWTKGTAGVGDHFGWTEVEWLAAGTWQDVPADDRPATSTDLGDAYEANAFDFETAGGDPTSPALYVRLYPVWNTTDKVFEYRFIYDGPPNGTVVNTYWSWDGSRQKWDYPRANSAAP
jgi:hypothetical protein